MPRDERPDVPETDTMIVSFQGEIAKVEVPKDENQQMVMIIISASEDATDIYLNGIPIDPETGERITPEETAPDSVVKAADAIVEAFQNGEWKIGSESFKRVSAAVEIYEQAKALASVHEIPPDGSEPDAPDDVPGDESAKASTV